MAYSRRFIAQIVMLVLSVVGIGVSVYLTTAHYENAPVACSTTGLINCERVLSSIYSSVPGTSIPISVPGLLFFIVSGIGAFCAWKVWPDRKEILLGQTVLYGLGMITVLYLVYVEFVDLHNICAWCTSLHIIILILFLIATFQLLQFNADDDEAYAEDEEEMLEVPAQQR